MFRSRRSAALLGGAALAVLAACAPGTQAASAPTPPASPGRVLSVTCAEAADLSAGRAFDREPAAAGGFPAFVEALSAAGKPVWRSPSATRTW